jgi:glycosyltransferase involved in cell wall biosynthesis
MSVTLVGDGTEAAAGNLREANFNVRAEQASTAAEVASVMRRHRFLVLPSVQEGFGIVAAEALHLGLPVIATRCGGVEGFLSQSGAAFMCDSQAADLSAVIEEALNLPEAEERTLRARATAFARSALSGAAFSDLVSKVTDELFTPGAQAPAREPIYVR